MSKIESERLDDIINWGKDEQMEGKEPTVWNFVWNNGKIFSSMQKGYIEAYDSGAWGSHGKIVER